MTVHPDPATFQSSENDPEMDKLMTALAALWEPPSPAAALAMGRVFPAWEPALVSRVSPHPYARQMYARPDNAPLTGGF